MQSDLLALDLPMNHSAPGLARAAVDRLGLGAEARESARLLASELVTNALLHSAAGASALIRVQAWISDRTLHLWVTDGGTGPLEVEPREDPGIQGGFGLVLVQKLAARWGVERGLATTVWCELPVGDQRPCPSG
jgi:anti-sigma regulatory factor (Ser/Thr protein kinase)